MRDGNRSTRSEAVVITGAGSGIGRALALAYADPGRPIALLGRQPAALMESAKMLTARGAIPAIYEVDVRHARDLDAVAQDFHRRFGPVGVLIANAGVSHGTLTAALEDRAVFQEIVDINLLGVMHTCSAFHGVLASQARVAGIASVAGFRGLPGAAAYSASKAAVIAYLESLRLEWGRQGVRVCTICPGYIATPMTIHNPYPMPWLMEVDVAARRMRRAIDAGRPWLVLPRPMAALGYLLRRLPIPIYDRVCRSLPLKPRRSQEEER
ncbi:MAG: SDR family oxidoreductase [Acidithiobacillus sp.]